MVFEVKRFIGSSGYGASVITWARRNQNWHLNFLLIICLARIRANKNLVLDCLGLIVAVQRLSNSA